MDVIITIGRNVKSTPMDDVSWADFQRCIARLLRPAHVELGRGEWGGVSEDNATVVGEWPDGYITDLHSVLAVFARSWKQDAIAYRNDADPYWTLVHADGTTSQGWEVV